MVSAPDDEARKRVSHDRLMKQTALIGALRDDLLQVLNRHVVEHYLGVSDVVAILEFLKHQYLSSLGQMSSVVIPAPTERKST